MTAESDVEQISTAADLEALVGRPTDRVAHKVRRMLGDIDRAWLAASPFALIATSDADGNLDVSPKGDPRGFAHVLDERQLAIPDRPGNRRVDGFHNVLANAKVGLIFLVPGRGDTLRINGRARLISNAPFFDDMVVKGHRPELALLVDVDEVFFHCSKAFLRSQLWDSNSWSDEGVPSRAYIAKTLERPDDSLEELERYYGPSYGDGMYRTPLPS